MVVDVTMPQMGESVVEGTVVKWLVREGEQVAEDQPIAEISTDKVDTEIPSPAAGVIAKLVAAEGETLPVGAKLAVIESAGRAAAGAAPPTARAEQGREAAADGTAIASRSASPAASSARAKGARYSPLVMKIAVEQGIDLSHIHGTGLGGRVSKRDVLAYIESLAQRPATAAAQPSQAVLAVPSTGGARVSGRLAGVPVGAGAGFRPPIYEPREGDVIEAFSRRRKLIAAHMVFSKTNSPHVGTVAQVDMTRVARLRAANRQAFREREGFELQFLPMVAYATVRALKEFPRMNSSVANDALIIRKEINLGIAVDTEEGLIVPVIKGADQHSVVGLAREIDKLARKAADKRIVPDDLAGGSFTISNPGREGNLFGLAIINQPQVGILRMGEVKKTPVVLEVDGDDAIAIRTIMYLALSYDHRVIDGVLGNRFLYRVARLIEAGDFEL